MTVQTFITRTRESKNVDMNLAFFTNISKSMIIQQLKSNPIAMFDLVKTCIYLDHELGSHKKENETKTQTRQKERQKHYSREVFPLQTACPIQIYPFLWHVK